MKRIRTSVLVVDSEYEKRCTIGALARMARFEVALASSGHQALALVGSPCADIDVVIAGAVMPDMSGLDLALRVRTLWPRLAIVLKTSGRHRIVEIVECGAIPLLEPFGSAALGAAVQEALRAHRS